ncbi:MAG: hypothetical protein ACYDDI_03100 [Candidatus Acidiferrales bacterium]
MINRAKWASPVVAMVAALATLGCCLPFGFLAALGAAGAGAYFANLRPWLLALSVIFLGLGFYQQYRGARCGLRRRKLSLILLWTAAVIVVLVILFPQLLAGLLAGGTATPLK